jgi:hypothetical protein
LLRTSYEVSPRFVAFVAFSPFARKFAGDGGLKQRAAPSVEIGAGARERGLAIGNLGE